MGTAVRSNKSKMYSVGLKDFSRAMHEEYAKVGNKVLTLLYSKREG